MAELTVRLLPTPEDLGLSLAIDCFYWTIIYYELFDEKTKKSPGNGPFFKIETHKELKITSQNLAKICGTDSYKKKSSAMLVLGDASYFLADICWGERQRQRGWRQYFGSPESDNGAKYADDKLQDNDAKERVEMTARVPAHDTRLVSVKICKKWDWPKMNSNI